MLFSPANTSQAGVITICSFIFQRETYSPTLLQRKTNRLKKETGNENLRSAMDSGLSPGDLFKRSIVRPTKMLLLSPIVLVLSIYMGVTYGYLYLLFTTISSVFEGQYHFSQGSVGLTFLGIGIGSLGGLLIFGIASDRILKHMAKKGEMKPEYRLPPLVPGAFLIPIGLFWYGWTAEAKVHWILPIIGTCFVGLGLMATFVCPPSLFSPSSLPLPSLFPPSSLPLPSLFPPSSLLPSFSPSSSLPFPSLFLLLSLLLPSFFPPPIRSEIWY
jgi:hypothetical protein